jgi:type I restriction enzyme S subunit
MVEVNRQDQRVLDWVGGVPDRWDIHSLGSQLAANKTSNKGLVESRVLSLSYGRVIIKPLDKLGGLVPESFETYQIVEPGDIVIRPTDLQNDKTSLRVGQAVHRGIITSAYICLRPTSSMNHRYAKYLLAAYDFMKVFYGFGSGLRQNLDVKHIKHIPIPVPGLDEQELIVRYLDHSELRIAKAIAGKNELLDLLKERRSSTIQMITLGHDRPKSQLKDSGVLWLKEIPMSWEAVPSKALFRNRRQVASRDDTVMTASQTHGIMPREEYMKTEGRRVMVVLRDSYALKKVEVNDFVISMRSFQGGIEWSRVSGAVSPAYVVLVPTADVFPEFFAHLLKCKAYISAIRSTSDYVRDGQELRYSNFGQVPLPRVPIDEQKALAAKITQAIGETDAAMQAIEREVALLKEYRIRLISDVVTGKLDVREEAAKLPEIDPMELATVAVGENGDDEEGSDDD